MAQKCYCLETEQEFKTVSDCARQLKLPYNKLNRVLKNNGEVIMNDFHISLQPYEANQENEWRKPYPEYDLEVNRNGQVRKPSTGLIRKPQKQNAGYEYITYDRKGINKMFPIHRLVAKAFIPDFSEDKIVDHINGMRDDNRLENLRILPQSENIQIRDKNNKPLYDELRRIVIKYGYEEALNILKQY